MAQIKWKQIYKQLPDGKLGLTGSLDLTGNVIASGFIGDGSQLTNLPTGSLVVTGSVQENRLTFTKGDGSTFTLTVDTGSAGSAGSVATGSLLKSASFSGNAITFTKGNGDTFDLLNVANLSQTNHFVGNQYISGALIPEALSSENGLHDLGSLSKPWRDLYITTGSLNFVKDGQLVSSVSGEPNAIRVGNVLITTASLAFVNNNGDVITTIATAEVSGSDVVGGEVDDLAEIRTFTGSAESRLDSLEAATGSYLATGSVVNNVITLEKTDGTSFTLTVDTGSELPITTGSITDFNTEVSRSAASFGFSGGEVSTADIQNSVVTASLSGESLIMTKRDLSSFSVDLGSLSPDIDTGSFFYSSSFAVAPDQLTFYSADGNLVVDLAGIAGSINDGDVTAVFAGDGLGGGGEAGNLVLNVNTSPSYGTNTVNDYVTIATSSLYFKKGVSTALTEHGVTGSLEISENLVVKGTVTAQEFHSEFVSASIIYESGSTKFGDTDDDNHAFTGSVGISGSLVTTGDITANAFIGDGSQLTGLSANSIFTGSVSASVDLDGNIFTVQSGSDEFLIVSSSGRLSVDLTDTGSTGIHTNNINTGYPSSNNWQENLQGSYFNNFDHNTHVSEILRFMAGVLSSSLDVADAKPNTKYWNNVSTAHSLGSTTTKNALFNGVLGSSYESAKLSNNWSSSAHIDLSQTGSIDTVQEYLISKGFLLNTETGSNQVGTNPFSNNYATRIPTTISTQASFGTLSFNVTANAGGTTDASSNANYFGLGALTNGGATGYSVRVISSQSFSDNYTDQTPDESSTFTTASVVDYSANSFGTTSDGLILSKIETSQPAVIPAAYQDGDFNNVDGPISGRKYTGGATSATSISASGYYKMHDIQVGIQTGSMSDFEYKAGSDSSTRFYLYTGDIPSDITSGTKTVTIHDTEQNRTAFSATSRSLSGAPYLLTTTYTITFEGSISGAFDPGYGYSTTPLQITNPTDTWENIGSTTLSNSTVTVNSNGVQTNSGTRGVLSADKATQRTVNSTPHIDDICFATSSLSFTLDSNTDNVGQNRSSQASLNYNLSFRLTGRNWKNSSQTSTTGTTSLYDAALFGQASASGSMAVYSRAQGYDAGSLTGTTEQFSGEDHRIQVTNDVLGFNGSAFTTDSFQTNDEGDSVLGDYDLQVKPGYLVDPGGNYGYWFASGFGSGDYKYYIRKFQTSGAKTTMTVNVGKTLVNWDSTSNGVAVALLFKSSASGSGANNELSQARIYDPSVTTSNLIESNVSADNFKNPFTDDLDLYGNTGGSVASTTYTVPLRNVDGMYLDNNDNEFYLIIRYKGDPTPVTSITASTS